MKYKSIALLALSALITTAVAFAATPAWCWVNILKKNDPRCPMTTYEIKELDGKLYSVHCYRISPMLGFLEAEPKPIGYSKTMYCPENLEFYNINCIYICEWTHLGGNQHFTNVDYKLVHTAKIDTVVQIPCSECCTD